MAVALGIDYEDIVHTPAYRNLDDSTDTTIDLQQVTEHLLELFNNAGVSVTFFIVADLAQSHPNLIRQIAAAGHEIASHTVSHCSLTDIDRPTTTDELHRSKAILEDIADMQVAGFRAPTCRINDSAYETLIEEGYCYSSSVMPSLPVPGFYSAEYRFRNRTEIVSPIGSLTEFPLSVHPRIHLPLSGAWMRLLGRNYTLHGMRSTLDTGQHLLTYSHPWEFQSLWETPLPFRNRVRTGSWLAETYRHILQLDAEFCTVGELLDCTSTESRYVTSPR